MHLFNSIRGAYAREILDAIVGVGLLFGGLIAAFYIAHGFGL